MLKFILGFLLTLLLTGLPACDDPRIVTAALPPIVTAEYSIQPQRETGPPMNHGAELQAAEAIKPIVYRGDDGKQFRLETVCNGDICTQRWVPVNQASAPSASSSVRSRLRGKIFGIFSRLRGRLGLFCRSCN